MTTELIAGLIGAIPIPVLYIDESERIAAINAAAEAVFSTTIQGRHYISAIRQPAVLDAVEKVLSDRGHHTARYNHRAGEQAVSYTVYCAPFGGRADRPGIVLSFDDTSDLEHAAQMRRDFVANVSHELRTPLTALLGFVETLKGAAKDDPEARARFLEIMEREASRMNRLVGDLLSLSRVESEERMVPKAELDIGTLLRSVVQALRPLASDNEVDLRLTLPSIPTKIAGDADQLQQVFTNLIENAVKYGGNGGVVDVGITPYEFDDMIRCPSVRITVRDFGEGIRPEHIARLTERFYRVDNHRSREMGGTGLGLAIVKHIINRHRGRLRIDSILGEGSTFTVVLRRGDQGAGVPNTPAP